MFGNLKVKTQLLALAGVGLTLFAIALLVAAVALQTGQSRFQEFIDRDAARLAAFNEMYAQGLQSGQALRNIMLDPSNRKAYDNLEGALADFDAALKKALALSAARADLAPLLEKVGKLAQAQAAARAAVMAEVAAGRFDEAKARLNKDETPAWRALKKDLLDGIARLTVEADRTKELLATESRDKQRQIAVIAVVAVLAMLVISAAITRNLLRHLGGEPAYVAQVAERIAKGDLSGTVAAGAGDRESLLAAFVRMQDGLRVMVGDSQQSARELAQAAEELKMAARQAATATEAQSAAASGMAASVEETSVSIGQVRAGAGAARRIVGDADEASRAGGRVIHAAADEMGEVAAAVNGAAATIRELENYSSEITTIINVIREVADQTNLLALNAAIEAARAGEQGRGFAVVADEVRKLAERTSESTRTIAGVIEKVQAGARQAAQEMESGVARVNGGVELARRAGGSITDIQAATGHVAAAVADIGNALDEQAVATQEIARGIERIANGAEENSASVRQSTAAAERLHGLAVELERSVARFRL